ncbi:MAG: PAS domain S-box protein [Gammaproteobacteria bacterium]|nr:PAS domain S-box protein [Gammaproteobacteria bacterium]
MITIVISVNGLAIFLLYETAFEQQRERLIETSHSQAKLISAVARFDKLHTVSDHGNEAEAATLSQIREAQSNYKSLGKTAQLELAKLDGDNIIYVTTSDAYKNNNLDRINTARNFDKAMEMALAGKSGTMITTDRAGNTVLSAYDHIGELNYGITSQININEIRAPFIRAGVTSLLFALCLIVTGSYLFVTLSRKSVRQLSESRAYNRILFDNSPIGLALCSMSGKLIDINSAYADIIGRTINEAKGLSYWDITPEEYLKDEEWQLRKLNAIGHYGPYEKEYIHKDGRRVPVSLNGQKIKIKDEDYIWSSVENISYRIQIEESLRNASEVNRKIISENPIGMAIYNREGQCIEANDAIAEMVGTNRDQLLKQNYHQIESWKKSGLYEAVETARKTGKKSKLETLLESTFGKTVFYKFYIVPFKLNKMTHILLVADDITERKDAEYALIRSEETSAKAQAIANIGHWDWDILTGELVWTDEIYRIFGLQPQEFGATYDAFLDSIHPDDRQDVIDAVNSAVSGDEIYNIEHRVVRPNNEIRIVHEQGKVYYNSDDIPVRMIGTVHDITNLKKAAESLRQEIKRNEILLKTTQDGYWIVNTDSVIKNCNESYLSMSGYDYDEIIGMNTSKIDFSQSAEDTADHITKLARDGFIKYETRHRCKDNSIKDMEVTSSLAELDGEISLISFFKDITERKQTDHELKIYRENLESLVADRTRELQDAQHELVRQERLATLGQLTATVSHELRNPLGAIQPSIYILKKKINSDDRIVHDAIDRIERNTLRCDHIIDELLDFTRIVEIQPSYMNINEWLTELINELSITPAISIEYELDPDNNQVYFDKDRLRRAIINIIDNAAHAIQDNNSISKTDGKIKLSTKQSHDRIILEINDNGSGISEDTLKRIFEPLFSTKGFGVGLGMPTVKQIMKQHNGGIDISSIEGKGTTVTLWLPKENEAA